MGPLLAASLLLALEIRGAGDCPGAAEVERHMGPLLGAETAATASDVATLARGPDGTLSLSLADTSGQALGARTFPRARTCGEQAKTVAVTLAVWEAQLHPEITLRLDRLASGDAPAPAPARAEVVVARPAPVPARAPNEVSLGVAAIGDLQAGAWAPGARVELGVGRAGARWRARVAAVDLGRHTLDVPPGQARYWRAFAQLGAEVDVARGRRFAASLGAGGLLGVVSIAGDGFAVNRSTRSLDVGAEARARLEWRPGRVRPWLAVSVVGALRRQALDLQGSPSSTALPRVTPLAALGADFVW